MVPHPPPPSGHLPLPASVEELLSRICQSHFLPPPEPRARRELAALGEEASLHILRQIATRSIKNLSAFIVYMAKNSDVALARNAEAVSTQESVCFSRPSTPGLSSEGDFSSEFSSSCGLGPRETASPHMVALGELDFRKAFLILSYIGRNRLEDTISVDLVKTLKYLPMVTFEEKVWAAIGCKCISESDRRKNLDWDSGKTHVFHCYVGLDGIFTFKGPYLQVTRTHLQRVLGDDNVLLVKFAEEMPNGKRSSHNFETFDVYHRIATEGILVGLRRYQFFVFKDGGKEEKKKNPTSSSVKCYFVRMESSWAMDENRPYILLNKSIHEARSIFMHVHTTSSLAKYMARFSLILSKTIKLDIDFASAHIQRIEDIPCTDGEGNIVYNVDGEPQIHTDGTGFISEDLAMKCPGNIFKGHDLFPRDIQKLLDGSETLESPSSLRHFSFLGGNVPLLIQFRLFYNGCAVKGTLLVDKRLPPKTIQVRPSMIKVEPDPIISSIQSCNSLEIVATSNQPKRTCLSRYLVTLLHYGGVPEEYFMELLMSALNDAQNARYNKQAALRVALKYGDMDDFLVSRMIFSGIPLDEPYLQTRLLVLMREERKGLKLGKLPVSECYYLMGTVDPTGTLRPNEVCIILGSGHISGDVLVYKSPGLHFGDIHLLTATYIKDLDNIVGNAKYAIFFPTKGPRSLADEMANSDFDGDMYWVSRNPQLLEYFKASKPWVRTISRKKSSQPKPTQFSEIELERELFQHFLINRFVPSYATSAAADSWLVFMDRLLTLGDDCVEEKQCLLRKMLQLVDLYYDALDASKSGAKVEVPAELKAEKYPHFMERTNSYHSTSILGFIYDKVDAFQKVDLPSNEIWQLPCFSGEVPQSCLMLWEPHYDLYRKEMTEAMSMDQESKDLVANKIIQKYKRILYGAAEFEESTRTRAEIFDEAVAIYQITYKYAKKVGGAGRCSFAWKVAGRALCMLHAVEQRDSSSIVCLTSVLREILG